MKLQKISVIILTEMEVLYMDEIQNTILMNQLRIMTALQRLNYSMHTEQIIEDLGIGIKDTQKILNEGMNKK